MTDSAPNKTTPLINTLPEFTSDVYVNIAPSELVTFAVYALQDNGHYSAIEEIVSACFRLFPHRFSLKNYFYWPDSALTLSFLTEAKNKGDLKGNPIEGFAVKVQGRQTVKRVAKVLKVTLPVPEKKITTPTPEIAQAEPVYPTQLVAEKKVEVLQTTQPESPVKKKGVVAQKKPTAKSLAKKLSVKVKKKPGKPLAKKAPAKKHAASSKEKKPAVPAAKVKAVKKKPAVKEQTVKPRKQSSTKQAAVVKVKAKSLPKLAPIKQAMLLPVQVEEPKKKEQAKPIASVPIKKTPAPKTERPKKQAPVKSSQPAQLTMSLPLVEEKKEKPAPPVAKKVEPKSVKVEMVIAPTAKMQVSKEERAKAGKVVQVMERSDAYRQYKKSGDKSKISEFDFRSLLLCTMESSPETLARNVNTFKGYANIQNRQDLVAFLNFVETSFSGLLNSSGKKLAKKK